MTPTISVIIHFLDAAEHLDDAVRSVLWQTLESWELILVDGGSSDRSPTIAAGYAERDPRIRLLRHESATTLGIFSSRVWGAREARASLLAHLDSDDEWHPRFLERQAFVHQRWFSARHGMVYGPMVYWWDDPERILASYVQPVPTAGVYEPPDLLLRFVEDDYSQTPGNSAVMLNREMVLAASELVGTAHEGMVEDQFLWSFIALRYPICVTHEPLSRYRQWPGSTCAREVKAGNEQALRATHLEWLAHYLSIAYTGADKERLLAGVRLDKRGEANKDPRTERE